MTARTAGIDRNEEITSLSHYIYGSVHFSQWYQPIFFTS